MAKARDAFRTISEVSEWLDTPAHVLRFWESKFSQVKPVKRAGGRRYYRPDDMALLAGIKALLHEQGMTIKGAQKLLREKGVKHVAALSPPINSDEQPAAKPIETKTVEPKAEVAPAPETKSDAPTAAPETVPTAPAMPPPMRPAMDATDRDTKAPTNVVAEPVAAQPAPPADVPPQLSADPHPAEPRLLSALQHADPARLRQSAAEIAPLLARLETVRDRMRAS